VINPPRDRGNRTARNNLLDEDHTTLHYAGVAPPHIESQIHLIEVAMKRNWNSAQARVQEPKPDQAHECPALK
jgi:hypothetical protein